MESPTRESFQVFILGRWNPSVGPGRIRTWVACFCQMHFEKCWRNTCNGKGVTKKNQRSMIVSWFSFCHSSDSFRFSIILYISLYHSRLDLVLPVISGCFPRYPWLQAPAPSSAWVALQGVAKEPMWRRGKLQKHQSLVYTPVIKRGNGKSHGKSPTVEMEVLTGTSITSSINARFSIDYRRVSPTNTGESEPIWKPSIL